MTRHSATVYFLTSPLATAELFSWSDWRRQARWAVLLRPCCCREVQPDHCPALPVYETSSWTSPGDWFYNSLRFSRFLQVFHKQTGISSENQSSVTVQLTSIVSRLIYSLRSLRYDLKLVSTLAINNQCSRNITNEWEQNDRAEMFYAW